MKEASGELSMTAIAVVAIGGIAVIFTTLILPNIKATITRNAACSQAFDCGSAAANGLASCKYLLSNNSVSNISCTIDN